MLSRFKISTLHKFGKADKTKDQDFESLKNEFNRLKKQNDTGLTAFSNLLSGAKNYTSTHQKSAEKLITFSAGVPSSEILAREFQNHAKKFTVATDGGPHGMELFNALSRDVIERLKQFNTRMDKTNKRLAARQKHVLNLDSAKRKVKKLETKVASGKGDQDLAPQLNAELELHQSCFDKVNDELMTEIPSLIADHASLAQETLQVAIESEIAFLEARLESMKSLKEVVAQALEEQAAVTTEEVAVVEEKIEEKNEEERKEEVKKEEEEKKEEGEKEEEKVEEPQAA
eukprot:TRINITY_DN179_c0_g1_i1.p1 TRINITY_DN179_c0_g1~~TRINITY_DN179_c0_g1_i1.p1  ORF type:complete len:287 (+),score=104.68 TRINITY_DN179_c0_g1_i1:95-955(+)